jgi:hypothetical protein
MINGVTQIYNLAIGMRKDYGRIAMQSAVNEEAEELSAYLIFGNGLADIFINCIRSACLILQPLPNCEEESGH